MPTSPGSHPLRLLLDRIPDEHRIRALTHPAFAPTHGESFERLEFLGDTVLGAAIAAELFRRFPSFTEGDMSRIKATAVSRVACAQVALAAGLGEQMVAATTAAADQELARDLARQERVLAALTESVIGAAFLSLGFEPVAHAVVASFAGQVDAALEQGTDAKSALQELAQRDGVQVRYELVEATGPDHDRTFTMLAELSGEPMRRAVGHGRSKKAAEQEAAQRLLTQMFDG